MNRSRKRENPTFFHIILTNQCNLQCTYCFGEATEDVDNDFPETDIDYELPKRVNYDLASLGKFCRKDPDCTLIFYGGEPLLQIEEMKKIMDNVNAQHFLIQTNGLFLDRLGSDYANRLHTIMVSIDGDEALTDLHRGKGTFRKVMGNLKLIHQNGFEGELIARMTVDEQTDIFKEVKWLLNNPEFSFSSVHWQLNAGFWKNDFSRRKFRTWAEENYNPNLQRLISFWVDTMEKERKVLKLYPFLGIAQSLLLKEEKSLMRCGGGWINYAIQTEGHIIPCPTMWGMKDYYVGHLSDANPLKLKQVFVGDPCVGCDIFNVCGGRCLYANITQRWDKQAYSLVCNTVRNLAESISAQLPRIRELIQGGTIDLNDFTFMKYNGCEIIP